MADLKRELEAALLERDEHIQTITSDMTQALASVLTLFVLLFLLFITLYI